jgi:hypothetical protein
MSADVAPRQLPDTRPLHRLLRRTRLLLRSSWLATGLGWTAGLLLGVATAVCLLDLLIPLPPVMRLAGLLLIIVPAGAAFLLGVLLPMTRRLRDVNVARRIEHHLPGIHNRLVSCVDLEATTGTKLKSSAFYRRLLGEAVERIRGFRAWRVLDLLGLRRASVLAALGTVGFVAAWVGFSDRMPTALARMLSPFADIPPVSSVRYEVSPGNGTVLREEKIVISARILSDNQPDDLWLKAEGGPDSKPFRDRLKKSADDPNLWTCTISDPGSLGAGYEDGFRYRVHGGRTWSLEYRIRLVERPTITSVETAVHFPEYMGIKEPRRNSPQTTEVTGPEGSQVEVIVRSQGEVAAGDVQLLLPGKRTLPEAEQIERVWLTEKPPSNATAGGTWNEEEKHAGRPAHTEPSAPANHRHFFQGDPAGHVVQAGDHLFAWVYLSRKDAPRTIMLQWHDGDGWEHGAFWGEDLIREGKLNTPARRFMGKLPEAGRWVRLDVPSSAVGLEGKTLRGMTFILYDGQVWWSGTGAIRKEEPTLIVEKSFPMKQVGEDLWSGRFPLLGRGLFRAELRNTQGHPSKPMKELRFTALPDQPPQVVLERPGSDITLSKAGTPPLTVAAYDDYGLEEVSLLFRFDEVSPFQRRILASFEKPERSRTLVETLSEASKLSSGGQLRYKLEARDRKKQTAQTREFVVRLSADPNSADQQLANFDKAQDPFQNRLAQLIAEQKKVQEALNKLETQYGTLTEKLRDTQVQTAPVTPMNPVLDKQPKVDPEQAKQLAAVQAELAKLTQQEIQNAKAAQQLSTELAKNAEQAKNLQMLAPEIAAQMEAMQQTFQQMAVKAIQDLAQRMQQGANSQKGVPDLKDLKARGDRLDKELEAIRKRMEDLALARKEQDTQKALKELSRRMTEQAAELTARELKELADFINQLRKDLEKLQGRQADLARQTEQGGDIGKAEQQQGELDRDIDPKLADAKNLLNTPMKQRPRKKPPEFPDSPYNADGKETKVPPKEQDTDDPLPNQKDKKKDDPKNPTQAGKDKKDEKEEEPDYQPALGGEKTKMDDRFKNKQRPVPKKPGDKNDPDARRNALQDRQGQRMQDLQAAQKALNSDQNALQQMMQQLQQAMQGSKGQRGQQGQQGLQQMMQQLQQAMQMAQRRRQGPPMPGQGQAQGPRSPMPSPATTGNMTGSPTGKSGDAELAKLPPDARAVILKLPPRVREDLLQGLREQGPEGYGPFIEDYFRRLTEK